MFTSGGQYANCRSLRPCVILATLRESWSLRVAPLARGFLSTFRRPLFLVPTFLSSILLQWRKDPFFQSPVSPFCSEPPSLLLDPFCQHRNVIWIYEVKLSLAPRHSPAADHFSPFFTQFFSEDSMHSSVPPDLSESPAVFTLPNPTFLISTLSSVWHDVQGLLCETSFFQLSRYPVFLILVTSPSPFLPTGLRWIFLLPFTFKCWWRQGFGPVLCPHYV